MTCGFRVPPGWPDDCPPEPHEENKGIYYRLIHSEGKATDEDFKSPAELGYALSGGKGARCRDHALSMFDTAERAHNFVKQNPNVGARFVGEVTLTGGHGVVRKTGEPRNVHIDWWVPQGVSPLSYFVGGA